MAVGIRYIHRCVAPTFQGRGFNTSPYSPISGGLPGMTPAAVRTIVMRAYGAKSGRQCNSDSLAKRESWRAQRASWLEPGIQLLNDGQSRWQGSGDGSRTGFAVREDGWWATR